MTVNTQYKTYYIWIIHVGARIYSQSFWGVIGCHWLCGWRLFMKPSKNNHEKKNFKKGRILYLTFYITILYIYILKEYSLCIFEKVLRDQSILFSQIQSMKKRNVFWNLSKYNDRFLFKIVFISVVYKNKIKWFTSTVNDF